MYPGLWTYHTEQDGDLCERCGAIIQYKDNCRQNIDRHIKHWCSTTKEAGEDSAIFKCAKCTHSFLRRAALSNHVCSFLSGPELLPQPTIILEKPYNSDEVKAALSSNTIEDRIVICCAGRLAIPGIWPFISVDRRINATAVGILNNIAAVNPYNELMTYLTHQDVLCFEANIVVIDQHTHQSFPISPPWTIPGLGIHSGFSSEVCDGMVKVTRTSVSPVNLLTLETYTFCQQ